MRLLGTYTVALFAALLLAATHPAAGVPLFGLAIWLPLPYAWWHLAKNRASRLAAAGIKPKRKRKKPARLTTQQEDALIEKWAAKGYVDPNSPKR